MKFLTAILLTLLSILPAWAAETLTLGVFAYRPKPVIEARYKPLADYLSSQLKGTQVKLEVMEREEMVDKDKIDNQLIENLINTRRETC